MSLRGRLRPRNPHLHSISGFTKTQFDAKKYIRKVLVVNDTPVAFDVSGEKLPYLDWESTGSNMPQLPVTMADVDSGSCIYTITTPLGTTNRALSILASGKTEISAQMEE